MNIELKPIAESKVRQLGGDVCGVLVRTQDSEVMAVSEHGRCTRLDAGVMGPAAPAGMSERELFEQRFPVPEGIYWNDISEQYDALPGAAGFDDVEIYHGQWMGWQAARAQGGQGAEVVSYVCHNCGNEAPPPAPYKMYVKCPCGATTAATIAADLAKQAQPQPAVPEGWRECLQEMVQAMYDYEMSVEEDAPYKHRAMMDRAHALLSTPTTPQADEWGGLIDRLANKAETENISVEVVFDDGYMREKFDTDISEHVANWLRGLKRPQPPAGQEGAQ